MLSFEEAREVIKQSVRTSGGESRFETIALREAHGRVLATDVQADRPYPALRRSLRDGFAVRTADIPGRLLVRGEVRAGETEQAVLEAGQALEIMTGAPVPADADAVIMIEHVRRADGQVEIDRSAKPGQFINESGAEAQEGTGLIKAGVRIDASHVATLAATGQHQVAVFRRPRVAILATGDEIVEVENRPAPHQIRNSNSYMLASLVAASGGLPTILPVAVDRRDELRDLLRSGLEHDMLLVSGGVSAGKYDLVKPTLEELGVNFLFQRVRIQPGQPTAFGLTASKPVFGLPGNPGSTLVTFQLFARLALELLSGITTPLLPLLSARFTKAFEHKGELTRFLPAELSEDGTSLTHIPWQGSSDIPALARANVFLVADGERLKWEAGDSIRVMLKV